MDKATEGRCTVWLHPHSAPGVTGAVTRPEVRRIAASAFGLRFADRAEMRQRACLGATLSRALPQTRRNLDARAHALAVYGNALRISGDYGAALSVLTEAREAWEIGSRSHCTGGLLAEIRASLFESMRETQRALSELEEAERHASARGHGVAKVLLQRGLVHAGAGDGRAALRSYGNALDARPNGVVLRATALSLASALAELEDWQGAQSALESALRAIRRWPSGLGRRVPWIRARIADLSGSKREAEALYQGALREFTAVSAPHDAALVSIDLSRLLLEIGKPVAAHRCAQRAGALLVSMPGTTEALCARLLMQVSQERLAAELVGVTASLFPLRRSRI